MVTTRWARATLDVVPPASKVRWARGELVGTDPIIPKVRWGRAELAGSAPLVPKVRWARGELAGTAAVLITPLTPVTVEPETLVTLTAMMIGGGVADSYTWRRISGPAITFMGSGASRSFYAPSAMPPGTSVTIGVTATSGETTSPEQTVVVTVLPQLSWRFSSGAWVGQRPIVSISS